MVPVIFFLAISIVSSEALSFNYTTFYGNDQNITKEKATINVDGTIQLVALGKRTSGARATYKYPMQLWENSSGTFADFQTYFSFIIDSAGRTDYRDGLAFFLAPVTSSLPINSPNAGSLGLTSNDQIWNSTQSPFVAVEFDIFKNFWDDNDGTHVGIDVNSMKSWATVNWTTNVMDGLLTEAWINYDSGTKNLSVIFTGYQNGTQVLQYLNQTSLDLRLFLPEQVIVGFSGSSRNGTAAHVIKSWNFTSTLETVQAVGPSPGSVAGNRLGLALGMSIGGFVLLIGFLGFVWICWCRMRNKNKAEKQLHMEPTGPKEFSYSVLDKATGGFKEKLGEGGFGGVYKGLLGSMEVAVKRISSGSKQGITEFASEVKIISRLRHRNLVQLMGWCHEKGKLLLVYEFMPNGSLDSHLFKGKSMLAWNTRYRIAQGLASALLYLQEACEQCVIHRDIKSSNIMLDYQFNTKLGDFGLARLVDHAKGSKTTNVAGTIGYLAPECVPMVKATRESDVYSFGVVCLEIACGRPGILKEPPMHLIKWVWQFRENGDMLKAADPNLEGNFNKGEMERLLAVGLACTLADSKHRLSVKEALNVLEFKDSELPTLPEKIPEGLTSYFTAQEESSQDSSGTSSAITITDSSLASNKKSDAAAASMLASLT